MISVIYSTRTKNSEAHQKYLQNLEDSIDVPHQIIGIVNDGEFALTEAYNKGMALAKYNNCIFIHDDIHLKKGWVSIVLNAFAKGYGILGVAGSTRLEASGKWWENPTTLVGSVYHKLPNTQSRYLTSFCPLHPNHVLPAAVVDGVFIAVDKTKIVKTFNENIKGFNFYDIMFCVENFLAGVKIGVTTDIDITHYSAGQVKEDWHIQKNYFLSQYSQYLPLQAPIEPLVTHPTFTYKKTPPKINILIPSKDNLNMLQSCITSVVENTKYPNYSIHVADTGSSNITEVRTAIDTFKQKFNVDIALHEFDWYHYGRINNELAKRTKGEYLLFLNDDVKFVNDVISILYNQSLKTQNVGTVGCRLLYGDKTIQHGGITFLKLPNGGVGVSHIGLKTHYKANTNTIPCVGSTAACLLIKRKLFEGLGGFLTDNRDCFEDVILNLKAVVANYTNIYVGEAVAYHYESQTRNKDKHKGYNMMLDYQQYVIPFLAKHQKSIQKFLPK